MLGKLLKYEFKSTAKTFLPLYGVLLLSAFISGLFTNSNAWNLATRISNTIFFGLCFAVLVLTVLTLIQRFTKNLLQDEGYLMMTLPVKTYQLILSKLLCAMVWSIGSIFVGMFAFYLLFSAASILTFSFWQTFFIDFLPSFFDFLATIPGVYYWTLTQSFLLSLLTLSGFILMVYLSLATGQLPMVCRHKKLASFGAFILLYIVNQIIMIKSLNFITQTYYPHMLFSGGISNLNNSLSMMIAVVFALNLAFFAGTNYILQKHLNLE